MLGYRFSALEHAHNEAFQSCFTLFRELILYTSGDVGEAAEWLQELKLYKQITEDGYTIHDFLNEMQQLDFLGINKAANSYHITPKMERIIRRNAYEKIFGQARSGPINTNREINYKASNNEECAEATRPFCYGDLTYQIAYNQSICNAFICHGIDSFKLTEHDLEVWNTYPTTATATVLLIDISHSMILYGEDRITPAKEVAMALSELIMMKYPGDSLDVVVFGDDARQIAISCLPYLKAGPYHTNTAAGLELAFNLLQKSKHAHKQIFMITDGKPSSMFFNGAYYKNSFGLDRKIVKQCLHLAATARRLNIGITTFMLAAEPELKNFVSELTKVCNGVAFFASKNSLGNCLITNFEQAKAKF